MSATTNKTAASFEPVVVKRDGNAAPVDESQVRSRIQALCDMEPPLAGVDVDLVARHVTQRLHSGITTQALDDLTARTCASRETTHPDYGTLAARVEVSNMHKSTDPSFSRTTKRLAAANALGKMDPRYLQFVEAYADVLDAVIDPVADYGYTYFGIKTLQKGYLLRADGVVAETPQFALMRQAAFLHGFDDAAAVRLSLIHI